jgi:Tfp pilus assembly protein PilF
MKACAILLLAVMVASCATAPVGPRPEHLFSDPLFTAPSERINAEDVFALSDEMRHYLSTEIADQLRIKGLRQGLIDALYSKNLLKVEYDSRTRNAAQTFGERAGNCLSLVIMTGALARELGMPVGFQSVVADETWTRSGDLYFSSGHVNLTVGKRQTNIRSGYDENAQITIDFVPPEETRGQRSWPLARETVIAMYMNNRAAEALARGQVNDAYWWVREAITQDPNFLSSYNTLGVIYRRHGNPAEAERALNHALQREPENVLVMSNLAMVLNDLGRIAEAKVLTAKVERRQPYPPFYFFNLGQAAMQAKNFKAARDLFAREVARDGYSHEFHFWLAAAYSGLGEFELSRKHLAIAMEFSSTRKEHDLYAAKLDRLKAYK